MMVSILDSNALKSIIFTGCCILVKVMLCETSTVESVRLYTDLINLIGRNDPCELYRPPNDTSKLGSSRTQINKNADFLLLTQYSFHALQNSRGGCESEDSSHIAFDKYHWVCSSTGIGSSLYMNWMFLDCSGFSVLSVDCISGSAVEAILNLACQNVTSGGETCVNYTTGDDRVHVCSAEFRVKQTYHTVINKEAEIVPESPIWDILACVSGAFILISFFVAVCLPDAKCRPKYSYDKSKELRVPLEIYEMYGVNYQPSAKKKVRINSDSEELTPSKTPERKGATVGNNNERLHVSRNLMSDYEHMDPNQSENRKTGPSLASERELTSILKNTKALTSSNTHLIREYSESSPEVCDEPNEEVSQTDVNTAALDTYVYQEAGECMGTGPQCRSSVVDEINLTNDDTDDDRRTSFEDSAKIVSRMLEKVISSRRVSIV